MLLASITLDNQLGTGEIIPGLLQFLKQTIMNITDIKCDGRLREDLGDIEGLAASISRLGLIQPIVVEEKTNILIAGGRRLAAMTSLGFTDLEHGKHFLWHSEIPEDARRELELEENVRRKEMNWKERVCAIAEIHTIKRRISALDSEKWGMNETGELLGISMAQVSYCVGIAKFIKDGCAPICEAESFTEAIKAMVKMKEDEVSKLIAESVLRTHKATPLLAEEYLDAVTQEPEEPGAQMTLFEEPKKDESVGPEAPEPEVLIPLSKMLFHMDCLKLMRDVLLPESVDHIITDPPYAIDMDMLEQQNTGMDVSSVRAEHDVAQNLEQWSNFLPLAYRVLRDKGFLVFWYDMDHHEKLQNMAKSAGFKVQRWPLVWVKAHSCINQSAQYNFTKATEVAMVCRKGTATLIAPQHTNYLVLENKEQSVWNHPFSKPSNLWGWILDAVAFQGQTILDPFAGVGSCPITALTSDLNIIACEINDLHFVQMKEAVVKWYGRFIRGNLKFV